MQITHNLTSIPNLYRAVLSFFGKNWKELLFLLGLPIGIKDLFAYINPFIFSAVGHMNSLIYVSYYLVSLLIVFVLPLFILYSVAVTIKYISAALDGRKALGKAYIETFSIIFPFIWIVILAYLCFFGASILFIIPGIVLLVYLQPALYLVIEGKYRGLSALSAAFQLVTGKWWKVFGRLISNVILIFIADALVIFIFVGVAYLFSHAAGSLFQFGKEHLSIVSLASALSYWITSVFSVLYYFFLYRSILETGEHNLVDVEIKKTKGFFLGLSIWGCVSIVVIFFALISIIGFVSLYNARYHVNTSGSYVTPTSADMLTYIDPVYTFTIQYPKNWDTELDNSNGSGYAMFFLAPVQQAAENGWSLRGAVVINVWGSSSALSLDQLDQIYQIGVTNEAKTLNDQWTILSKKTITFQGIPALEYTSTKLRTFDGGETMVTQKNQDIVFTKNNLIYNISYHAGFDNFDILLPTAEEMIASFKVGKYPQFNVVMP